MDPSTNQPMNGAQHTNSQSYNLLHGIQDYGGSDTIPNNEDLSRYFDPELFESTTIGNGFSQPSLSMAQDFDSNAGGQTSTPEVHQYSAPQQTFTQHQFTQQYYNPQQMNQSNYDPRFYPRPSASPVGFENGYPFQPAMNFTSQHFGAQQINIPQRQSATPLQNYPQRQQPSQFVNIAQRPSQLSHSHSADMMRFGSFQIQDQTHQPSRFVDPSMLTANQTMNTNGNNNNFQSQQSYMPPSYFKPGSAVDPRSMQGQQPLASIKAQQPVVIIPKFEQAVKQVATKDPNAVKRPRGRPRKDASGQPGDQSSDDELEIEDDEPPEMTPAILTISPTDERGKIIHSAVQAVWSPRNKPVDPDQIRNGIANYGNTLRDLRDAWKTKNESLRKAELPNSPTAAEAVRLKEEVARYRQMVEVVMVRSLQYSHPAIAKRLGENQFIMAALSSFMLDRVNVSDFDSALTFAILKFVVKFETLDSEMLELTKLSKILLRLTKKSTGEIKTLSQMVLSNAAVASKKKITEKKSDKPASPGSIGSPADGSRKELAAGVKRLREGDLPGQPAAKKAVKVMPQSSKPLAVRLEEKRKAEEAAKRAKGSEKGAAGAVTTAASSSSINPAAKAKVAVAAPQKSAIFAALSSVPKKPGTSNAERAAAAAKDKVAPATATLSRPVRKESPPRKSGPTPAPNGTVSSSFLGVLLDMEKKPEKEVRKEVDIPNETAEEKAKRLRKEGRRRLRVSWKADDVLVETRFFTHDPDEELDQGDRLKANAGGGREGEALKLHKVMDDLEDDEEDEDSFEEFETYTPLSEVDFTYLEDAALGDDSLHKTNSPKFGGAAEPSSRSRESQGKYEQDTLMAIYTSKTDRPPTPKEPDDSKEEDDFEPAEPETPFGEPEEKIRDREKEYQARQGRTAPQPPIDLYALAQSMAVQQRPQQQATVVTPEVQRALSMFGQPTQPAPAPQAAVAPSVNLQAILQSVLGQQSQSQQPQYPAATTPDINALLASMQSTAQPANPLPVGMGSNPNPFPGNFEDSSRKHGRTESNGNEDEYGKKGGNKKKKGGADTNKPYNYKTQVCTFWEQGKCLKGDSCTYRHGNEA